MRECVRVPRRGGDGHEDSDTGASTADDGEYLRRGGIDCDREARRRMVRRTQVVRGEEPFSADKILTNLLDE